MLDAYRDLIDGLTEESTTLRELLGTPVSPDISQDAVTLLKDMRGRESAMLARSQKIMRGENVNLRAIENEPAVKEAQASDAAPEDLVSGVVHDRGELVSLLMNLTLKDWERRVPHYVRGETTLSDEVEDHLTWEEEALARLESALG